MTYSIRTKCGDIWLKDWIGAGYYEYVDEEQRGEILDEIFRQCVKYVNDRLPENLTWFPYISEVYVTVDEETEDDRKDKSEDEGDEPEDVDEMISRLSTEYSDKLDEIFGDTVDLDRINAFGETL